MIESLQGLIGQVRYFDEGTLSKSFEQVGYPLAASRVLFFGEEHTDIVSQIETLGAINAIAKPGDTILLEGGDRATPIERHCGFYLLLSLYINWQWEKLGEPYSVGSVRKKMEWQKEQGFGRTFIDTKRSYNISDLNISRISCGFWDSDQAIKETFNKNEVTKDTLLKRNTSMVEAIKMALARDTGRALVISGFMHLPTFDYLDTKRLNKEKSDFPESMQRYYELVREARNKPQSSFKMDSSSGTTEPIFKYLTENNIPFREFIHRRLER